MQIINTIPELNAQPVKLQAGNFMTRGCQLMTISEAAIQNNEAILLAAGPMVCQTNVIDDETGEQFEFKLSEGELVIGSSTDKDLMIFCRRFEGDGSPFVTNCGERGLQERREELEKILKED